jgi:hypothetical protein
MTNATTQKVCYLTLNSTSEAHRHTLGGAGGHRGYVRYIYVELHRLGAPTVNHIYYVHLRWGYVFRGIKGLLWVGIRVGIGGGRVRYKGAQINPSQLMAVLHRSWGTIGGRVLHSKRGMNYVAVYVFMLGVDGCCVSSLGEG